MFLLEHQQRYKGKVVEEVDYLLEYEKLKERQHKEKTIQSKVDLNTEIEEIVNQAKQKTSQNQTNQTSNRSKIGSIRENRTVEKMIQREEEAFELNKSNIENSEVVPFNQSESMRDTGYDLLLRKQKEALNKKMNRVIIPNGCDAVVAEYGNRLLRNIEGIPSLKHFLYPFYRGSH